MQAPVGPVRTGVMIALFIFSEIKKSGSAAEACHCGKRLKRSILAQ
jgi:hypothetical protein